MAVRLGAGVGHVAYKLGFAFRETAQALDRIGSRLQGNYAFREELNRNRPIQNLFDKVPSVGSGAFVAPSASVIGDVSLGEKASVFYGSVLKGDDGSIKVGARSNIQDGVVIKTAPGSIHEHGEDSIIGQDVTIGHKAIIYGAKIGDGSLIGIGAKLGPGSVVESGAIVAAGSVVEPGTTVPSGQLWGGSPAKFLRALKPEEADFLPQSAALYVALAAEHATENIITLEERAKAKGLA